MKAFRLEPGEMGMTWKSNLTFGNCWEMWSSIS